METGTIDTLSTGYEQLHGYIAHLVKGMRTVDTDELQLNSRAVKLARAVDSNPLIAFERILEDLGYQYRINWDDGDDYWTLDY